MRLFGPKLGACALLFVSLAVRADVVADWADQTTAIADDGLNTVRTMALAQSAVYEAVNAITARYPRDRVDLGAAQGASIEAAVAAASRAVLLHETPALKERTEAAYAQALGKIAENDARTKGINLGERAAADAEKKALMDKLSKPSGVSDDERLERAIAIIKRAANNGATEVEVARFPNTLCSDRGRAINQQERGWETTLTGVPKELFEFWQKYLKQNGFKLRVQIVDFPGGMPGDVGMTLSWS